MQKIPKNLKCLSENDYHYLIELASILAKSINTDNDAKACLAMFQKHCSKNSKPYSLGHLQALPISEGSKGHNMLKTALCLALGRGLNRGEIKRITWLVSGNVSQQQSGKVARNITLLAKQKTYKNQSLAQSKALKNVA